MGPSAATWFGDGGDGRHVVHDLRHPLAVLGALIASTQEQEDLPLDTRNRLDEMKDQVRLLADLCSRLLDDRPSFQRCSLDGVVRHVVRGAEHAYDRGIEVEATPCAVLADATSVGRATWNLLENACRAAGPSGTVRVTVRPTPSAARVEVEDAGPGFGDGPSGTASLGLSIVDAVAREHHGRVEIGRSELGGASVCLALPLPDEGDMVLASPGHAPTPSAHGSPRATAPGSRTVVICDDHRMFAESLGAVLRTRGHVVLASTTDPTMAVAEVAAHGPDILLMDLHFPDQDGADAVAAALRVSPRTRVVVLSGVDCPASFERAEAAGAWGCLVKDGDMSRIFQAIDAAGAGRHVFDRPVRSAAHESYPEQDLLRFLTERERQVLDRLVRGQPTATIAGEMGMAHSTTRSHVQNVLSKLGVHSRLEAVSLVTAGPGRET